MRNYSAPTYPERFALFIVGGQRCFAPCPLLTEEPDPVRKYES